MADHALFFGWGEVIPGRDGPPRCEASRDRQLAEAAGNDAPDAGGVRDRLPLYLGNAEDLPLPDATFGLAISEYETSIWCDPYAWIPEAARILRPGGRLVFLVIGILVVLTSLDEDKDGSSVSMCLERPLLGMHRLEWPNQDGVIFGPSHGELIRVLLASGFEIEQLLELAPVDDRELEIAAIPNAWARQWSAEEVWCARKR